MKYERMGYKITLWIERFIQYQPLFWFWFMCDKLHVLYFAAVEIVDKNLAAKKFMFIPFFISLNPNLLGAIIL